MPSTFKVTIACALIFLWSCAHYFDAPKQAEIVSYVLVEIREGHRYNTWTERMEDVFFYEWKAISGKKIDRETWARTDNQYAIGETQKFMIDR